MLAHRHFTKLVAALTALAVCLCLLAAASAELLAEALGGKGVAMEYEAKLFDTDAVLDINIRIDDADWQNLLDNAINEEYIACDVEVGGEVFKNVGIRPKGNTSLSSIVNDPDSNRYSFKLEFDRYVEGQTCFGLDKLVLNNNYADATNMKEAVVYDMYRFLGADASLYNYAKLSVNGEYFGIYLALEAVEDSFMLRNFGAENGALYKPDSMAFGGGGGKPGGGDAPDFGGNAPDFGGIASGSGGANLNYIDDDLDSYETIWEGEVTDTGKKDHKRVVAALKAVSEGRDLETYLDVDNILRYMAVHTFVVNADSLSGNMAHNYYLYESGGRLNILPWDYNLSFGGMNGEDASSVVNDAIDTPFAGTQFFDALLENEEYRAKYHDYLAKLVDEYVFGGGFDETYTRIRAQIDALVETDPNALYTYAEYTAAAEMLYNTVRLRGESVRGQLDGSIPSTDAGQRADASALVDASSIDISVMGTMMGGGGRGGDRGGDRPWDGGDRGDDNRENSGEKRPDGVAGDSADGNAQTPPTPPDDGGSSENRDSPDGGSSGDDNGSPDDGGNRGDRAQGDGGRPQGSGDAAFGGDGAKTASTAEKNLLLYGGMLLLALLGLGVAALYKRK